MEEEISTLPSKVVETMGKEQCLKKRLCQSFRVSELLLTNSTFLQVFNVDLEFVGNFLVGLAEV